MKIVVFLQNLGELEWINLKYKSFFDKADLLLAEAMKLINTF